MSKRTVFLKIKIVSLVAEVRIIQKQEQKAFGHDPDSPVGHEMVAHRKTVIRAVSRNTLLAYGFLRGRTYRQIEQWSKTEPDWKEVRRMISQYGDRSVSEQEFVAWKSEPEKAKPSPSPVCKTASRNFAEAVPA